MVGGDFSRMTGACMIFLKRGAQIEMSGSVRVLSSSCWCVGGLPVRPHTFMPRGGRTRPVQGEPAQTGWQIIVNKIDLLFYFATRPSSPGHCLRSLTLLSFDSVLFFSS